MTRDGRPADPWGTDPWGTDPRRAAGPGGDGDVDLRAVDVVAVAATDELLDRLGARRPRAEDLDDPAAAVLALLATEVDLNPLSEDALRRDLFDLGAWPIVPAGAPPPGFLAPADVVDLRSARPDETAPAGGPAWAPVGGPAWRSDPYDPEPARRPAVVRPPRQVRVRLLAVAAAVVLGLFGVTAAATGTWRPGGGSSVAGAGDGAQITSALSDGLELVRSNDLDAAKAKLIDAATRSKDADLTPDQRKQVDAALQQLWSELNDRGVDLPAGILPGRAAVRPAPGSTLPGAVPSTSASSAATTTEPATDDPDVSPTTEPTGPSEVDDPTPSDAPPSASDPSTTTTTTEPVPPGQTGNPPGKGNGASKSKSKGKGNG